MMDGKGIERNLVGKTLSRTDGSRTQIVFFMQPRLIVEEIQATGGLGFFQRFMTYVAPAVPFPFALYY